MDTKAHKCPSCKKAYRASKITQIYCSAKCRQAAYRKRKRQQLISKIVERVFVYDRRVIALALYGDFGVILGKNETGSYSVAEAIAGNLLSYGELDTYYNHCGSDGGRTLTGYALLLEKRSNSRWSSCYWRSRSPYFKQEFILLARSHNAMMIMSSILWLRGSSICGPDGSPKHSSRLPCRAFDIRHTFFELLSLIIPLDIF